MMFPGHGSYSLGMLINIAKNFPIITQTFYEASEILKYDLWKLILKESLKEVNQSSQIQPLLLTSSVAIFRLWKQLEGPSPTILVGHSLGEYSALVCSETIKFSEALSLIKLRGKMMEEIALKEKGAMLIILGLNKQTIIDICKVQALDQIVAPAIFNSPKQIVISGHKNAVRRVGWFCKAAGAKIIPFPVNNICSHCDLLKPMISEFAKTLQTIPFKRPKIPILNNVDVKCEQLPKKIRSALVRQLYNPVQWIECVEYINKQSLTLAIEVGPGKILRELTKRITSALTIISIENYNNLLLAIKKLKSTI